MKNLLQRIFLVGAFAIAGIITTQTTAMSQEYVCIIVDGCKYLIVYDACGNAIVKETDCGSSGTGVFTPSRQQGQNLLDDDEGIPDEGPLNVSLDPVALDAVVTSPTQGAVTTSLDPDRVSPPTTIISNDPEVRFPATVRIQFYAKSTISGKTFISREPLIFEGEVNSVNPFKNEKFELVNNVEFYNPDAEPQNAAFRLDVKTTVTLGSQGEPENDELR